MRKISTCYRYLRRHCYVEIRNNPTFVSYDALCVAGSEGGENSSKEDTLEGNLKTQVLPPLALMWGAELICWIFFFTDTKLDYAGSFVNTLNMMNVTFIIKESS